MISSLLVANRGEVAVRIIKTARRLGIRTIAAYTEADRNSFHVRCADHTAKLKGDSYLIIEDLLEIAKDHQVDALHPGYGFLSESPLFAAEVINAGIIWIGPSPAAMNLLGDKLNAKKTARTLEIPTADSIVLLDNLDEEQLNFTVEEFIKRVGFPIILKAKAGGGGRGMRIVHSAEELLPLIIIARSEAKRNFGDGTIFAERYLEDTRHIELQIIGDSSGEVIVVGDRDCTLQRRHQKIIEECPSPALSPDLRIKLYEDSIKIAKTSGYFNAGTVEFLVTRGGERCFLEVNTRLQVEHPVTEMVYGIDLVELQIRIAQGELLNSLLPTTPLVPKGHAIEIRVCAESYEGELFTPSTGELLTLDLQEDLEDKRFRYDFGYQEGDHVSANYDSLLGKIIAWEDTRERTRQALLDKIQKITIFGVDSNLNFIEFLLLSDQYANCKSNTRTVEALLAKYPIPTPFKAAIASAEFIIQNQELPNSFREHQGYRLGWNGKNNFRFLSQNKELLVELVWDNQYRGRKKWHISFDGRKIDDVLSVEADLISKFGDVFWIKVGTETLSLRIIETVIKSSGVDSGDDSTVKLKSNLPGRVVRVDATKDQIVEMNTTLVVLESMKMEHPIKAPFKGRILGMFVKTGDIVDKGAICLEIARYE